MYVSWDTFQEVSIAGEEITEEQYKRLAPMADAIIDDWTLERVGRDVRNGEELPDQVVTLYAAIVENLPAIMDNTKMGKGGLVSSFSNGIDSYTFDVSVGMMEQLHDSVGWMLNLLPIEWISACVYFDGGSKYAR